MFDTSLVRTRNADSFRFSVLTVSLAIHSAVIVAAISASIASIDFPVVAPDQSEIFTPVVAPSIPPLPKGQPIARAERARENAPQTITDAAPERSGAPPNPTAPLGGGSSAEGTPGEGPIGDPNGTDGGLNLGQPATPTGPAIGDMTYRPGGEVRAARVVRRVEPRYPQIMVHARMAAVVTVSCIVGKDGRVREPAIIKSSYPPFNAAVIEALEQWTFTPGTMRGQPVDTWFELTVSFNVR